MSNVDTIFVNKNSKDCWIEYNVFLKERSTIGILPPFVFYTDPFIVLVKDVERIVFNDKAWALDVKDNIDILSMLVTIFGADKVTEDLVGYTLMIKSADWSVQELVDSFIPDDKNNKIFLDEIWENVFDGKVQHNFLYDSILKNLDNKVYSKETLALAAMNTDMIKNQLSNLDVIEIVGTNTVIEYTYFGEYGG